MISPHSAIPALTITRSDLGWLVTCAVKGCGFERHCERRPGADRVASDHAKTHGRKGR